MKTKLIAVALSILSTASLADDPNLFNVTLGRSIESYPRCFSPDGEGKICVHGTKHQRGDEYWVNMELRPERPKYLKTNLTVTVKADTIIEIMVDTHGVRFQDEIMEYLSRKYGKPTSLRTRRVQNGFGAQFDVIEASWALAPSNAAVTYIGATDSLNEGYIAISHRGR
jgi:hypothetical protein